MPCIHPRTPGGGEPIADARPHPPPIARPAKGDLMPSIRALYNDELVQAHREAVATLRELLATEKDPLERRKLANALLRARPAKDDALPPSPASAGEGGRGSARPGEGASSPVRQHRRKSTHPAIPIDNLNLEDEDLTHPLDQEINKLSHQFQHGPDQLAALNKLHAIVMENAAALPPGADVSQNA